MSDLTAESRDVHYSAESRDVHYCPPLQVLPVGSPFSEESESELKELRNGMREKVDSQPSNRQQVAFGESTEALN